VCRRDPPQRSGRAIRGNGVISNRATSREHALLDRPRRPGEAVDGPMQAFEFAGGNESRDTLRGDAVPPEVIQGDDPEPAVRKPPYDAEILAHTFSHLVGKESHHRAGRRQLRSGVAI
jgi:hypothetical protein